MSFLSGFFKKRSRATSFQDKDNDVANLPNENKPTHENENYPYDESQNLISMAKKTVITKVMDVETSDAIVEFPQNRTLLVDQFTDKAPAKAEIIKGIRNTADLFAHFKPVIKNMEFEGPDGESKREDLTFNSLRDFEKEGLLNNSQFLNDLGQKIENYQKIEKQLKTNKILRDAISDPESRQALISSLQALLKELQDAK